MKIRGAAVVVALALGLTACGASAPSPFKVEAAPGDVTITSCLLSTSALPVAQIRVTNHTSYRADYTTSVDFTIGSTVMSSVPHSTGGVASGRSVKDYVTGTQSVAPGSRLTCKIASVKRNRTFGVTTPT